LPREPRIPNETSGATRRQAGGNMLAYNIVIALAVWALGLLAVMILGCRESPGRVLAAASWVASWAHDCGLPPQA